MTEVTNDDLLNEAAAFAEMTSHRKLAVAFVAMAGMYASEMAYIASKGDKKRFEDMMDNFTTVLCAFPSEVTENIVAVLMRKIK